ncbi:MAG: hypothetical protein ACRD22_16175 [Terriglobia bacterium]
MNVLDRELRTFQNELPELLAKGEGKFALVVGEKVLGTYEAYGDALQAGCTKAGIDPFLVKKITSSEEVAHFTRALGTSCQALVL